MRPTCRLMRFAVGFLVAAFAVLAPAGKAGGSGEYEVKAAYLFNFTKFVEYPSGAVDSGKYVVGIVGEDPSGGAVAKAFEGKSIDGRPAIVRRFGEASQAKGCNLVFLAPSRSGQIASDLAALSGSPILTVGDTRGYAEKGVMIELLVVDSRVRFKINLAAARSAHLQLSSKLLQLAQAVVGS